MRRKGLIAGLLILAVLLGGCKKADPKPLEMTLDPTPEISERIIYLNGTQVEPVYQQKGLFYLEAAAMANAFGGTVEVFEGMEEHQAVMTIGEKTYSFTSYKGAQTTEAIYYYKGSLYDGKTFYCPVEALTDYFGLTVTQDYSRSQVYYYGEEPEPETVPEGVEVPVMMYHAVSDDLWGIESLFVSPARMEEQLKWLTENEYTPIWFEDLTKLDKIKKPIILTFDDGYEDNYTELFPLLKKYNVKATVFMITGSIGEDKYLTEAQIKEMAKSGLVSFQSHTVTHSMLPDLNAEELETELTQSKKTLAKLTGKEPFVLCYPTGKQNAKVREAVAKEYQFALLMSGKTWETGENPMMIYRKFVARDTTLNQFKNMVK